MASRSRSARSSAARSSKASPGTGSSGSTCRSASSSSPLALRRLEETHGPAGRLDLPGLALASAGLLGIVWGLVRGNAQGWTSAEIVGSLAAGAALVAAFVAWELRARRADAADALLPQPRASRSRTSRRSRCSSGCSARSSCSRSSSRPCRATRRSSAGLRILPWTLAADLHRSDRGCAVRPDRRPRLIAAGPRAAGHRPRLDRAVSTPTVSVLAARSSRSSLAGVGMALFFAPVANVVLSPFGPRRRGRRRAPTTRSASSAACSASRCSPSVFAHVRRLRRRPRRFSNGMRRGGRASAPVSSRSVRLRGVREPALAGSAGRSSRVASRYEPARRVAA